MEQEGAEVVCRSPSVKDLEADAVHHLCGLINRVYDDAESGLWNVKGARTSIGEIENLLRTKALILAECRGVVVGSVSVKRIQTGVAEFGMLVVDPAHRNKGIGSALVEAAEDWARAMNCELMRLELLTPRKWNHPGKEILKEWYARAGYRPQFAEPFERSFPDKVPQLATECDFTVWQKRL